MTPEQETRIRLNLAQHKAANMLQTASIIGGLIGAIWKGWPAILIGIGLAILFHYAKPGPNHELDKATKPE